MTAPHTGRIIPWTRRRLLRHGGALAAASLAAAAPFAAARGADPKRPIIVGLSQEPTVFHPLLPHIEVDDGLLMNLFSALWFIDETGMLQPDLAVTVPSMSNGGISPDGRDWRVTLRPDATWHDGQPVTVADILFTLNCLRDPAFPAFSRTGVELIDDIRQTGPHELTWRMRAPYAPLPAVLASVMIVPAHRLAHDGDRQAFSTDPVGSGPFMWGGRIPSEEIRLAANPRWHLGVPGVDRVIIRYIPDITVMFTQFETGEIDFLGMQGIPPDRYAQARALTGRRPIRAPQPFIEGMAFNLGRPQFQDPAVRTAIYEAIDKDTILETICENVEQPTESFLPRESAYFDAALPPHRFDPQAARERLDRAGWRPGPDGVRRRDGIRLEFTNATTAGNPIRAQIQEVIQESLLDIGIVMRIENRPAAVMWGAYWTRSQFDSALVSVDYMTGSDPDASPYFQSDRSPARGGAGQNVFQYANPEVDALFARANTSFDHATRVAAFARIQQLIRRDLPLLPFYQVMNIEGLVDGLDNYRSNVNVRSNLWNLARWRWAS